MGIYDILEETIGRAGWIPKLGKEFCRTADRVADFLAKLVASACTVFQAYLLHYLWQISCKRLISQENMGTEHYDQLAAWLPEELGAPTPARSCSGC